MVKIISKETKLAEMQPREPLQFNPDFDLRKVLRMGEGKVIGEFIGGGQYAQAFNERREYQVDVGRDREPILYGSFYNIVTDPTLPEVTPVYLMGPAGVVLEEITEGGEVKFIRVESSEINIRQRHFGFGLEYTKQMVKFNRLWQVGIVEQQAGIAYNARLNDLHFAPILAATLTGSNATDGTALETFKKGASMVEKYLRATEAAIQTARTDKKNPRRGPYDLLISSGDLFTVERALNRVAQVGFDEQSSALQLIQNVIAYDGWTGVRGKTEVTYPGVTPGQAYLIHKGNRDMDYMSLVSQPLELTMGNPDVSRFILEQMIWDTFLGVYANPTAGAHKITWPVAASGAD